MSILSFSNLSYSYDKKKNVFSNISAEMELGKIYAILGQSGCGKTTLLSLLGGLDSATKGKILFNGEDIMEKGLANHRRNHVSFVFQAYNLIDYMTPLENVKLTSKLPPEPILEKMGLTKEEMKRNVGRGFSKQLFVTTHSPFFVNALSPEEVWVLRKEEDGFSVAQRVSDYPFVNELAEQGVVVGDLWYDKYFG